MKKKELTCLLLTLIPLLGAVHRTQAADVPTQPVIEAVQTTTPAPQPAPAVPAVIDCQYKLPADLIEPTQAMLSTWAKQAAIQSFQFNPDTLDAQLTALKACYTELGFKGFNEALEKSGNLNAIKSKKLTVKSTVKGEIVIQTKKDNQWKIKLPLEVTYENKDQKLTQNLTIDLLITRQSSGALGIMQVIAIPQT
ncbi:MAG: DotI/IcmL family type IV secretion protein [Legionellaceae bacterium]